MCDSSWLNISQIKRNRLCYLRELFYALIKRTGYFKMLIFHFYFEYWKMSSCFARLLSSLHLCPMRYTEHAYKVLNDRVMKMSCIPPSQKVLQHLWYIFFHSKLNVRMTHIRSLNSSSCWYQIFSQFSMFQNSVLCHISDRDDQ